MVWDGEVGMAEGLARVRQEEKGLILADSKAAAGREKRDLDTYRMWLTRLQSGGNEDRVGESTHGHTRERGYGCL